MKIHPTSFVLGVGVAASLIAARKLLRPVAVEVSALAVHAARIVAALAARQREHAEDFVAEARARANAMARGARRKSRARPVPVAPSREAN